MPPLFGLTQPLDDATRARAAGITRESLSPHGRLSRYCIVPLLPFDNRCIFSHERLRDTFAQLCAQCLIFELAVARKCPKVVSARLGLRR
jgi:hypothetical protein